MVTVMEMVCVSWLAMGKGWETVCVLEGDGDRVGDAAFVMEGDGWCVCVLKVMGMLRVCACCTLTGTWMETGLSNTCSHLLTLPTHTA